MNVVLTVLDLLEGQYHNEANPPELGHGEPLDGLILTVLSQNTNDRNRDVAYARLRERYPSWEDVAAAEASALAEAIRPAGLSPTKAARILTILATLRKDLGGCTLEPMRDWERERARDYLTALPGVGAKTAACVLLFDLKWPAFPVDTHVARVSRRVGFVPPRASPEEISAQLEAIVPPERHLGGHVNLIAHGRAVCRAQRPLCGTCVLREMCQNPPA